MNPRKRKKAPKATDDGGAAQGADSKRRKLGGGESEQGASGLMPNINAMNVEYGGNEMAAFIIGGGDGSTDNQSQSKPKVKSTPSRSISNLAKVNTKGMKSMMSYFSKPKGKK